MTLVGAPEHPHASPDVDNLIFKRGAIGGSLIGGIAKTQKMLSFCAEKGRDRRCRADPVQQIDAACAGCSAVT
jgi:alcohol dehydrogenase (NADP+)